MEVLNEILLQRNTFSVVVTLHGFRHFLTELATDSVIISTLRLRQKARVYLLSGSVNALLPSSVVTLSLLKTQTHLE